MMLERMLQDCKIPGATKPLEALQVEEYAVAAMWLHDRLRDALLWRALLMEAPERYPFSPPSEWHYLRRYPHAIALG